jgi:uncharacterized SAM-binding protein YcdF (DUF218 family)
MRAMEVARAASCRPVELSQPSRATAPVRAVAVLGCSATAGSPPGSRLALRLERTMVEARRDPTALVVVTGTPDEAAFMVAWLKKAGLAPARLRVDAVAQKTLDNAINSVPILIAEGIREVTVVTEEFHIHRGATLFERELARWGRSDIRVKRAASKNGGSGAVLVENIRHEPEALARDLALQLGRPLGALPKKRAA